jgi:hypothetical protein
MEAGAATHHQNLQHGVKCVDIRTSAAKSEKQRGGCTRIVRTRNLYTLFADDKLLRGVVARDGIEPPTPAFSGPRSTN